MIPKIVHYIWFGPKPFPKKVEYCISSWKKYLSDYEFRLWNEQTFDIDNSCIFVKDAYKYKKYAFVSDYVRLWALCKYGGVYLDTDIEVLKPFSIEILSNRLVLGTDDGGYLTALMMSESSHPYIKESLKIYHRKQFVLDNGRLNMEVNNTALQNNLAHYGYVIENRFQHLKDGIEVYPDDFFHVRSLTTGKLHLTPNSFAIHWHTITWVSLKTKLINRLRIKFIVPLIGKKRYGIITNIMKNGKTTI